MNTLKVNWLIAILCVCIQSNNVTSVCTVTVTSPNGQTVYASENEHITAQCVYSAEGCSDLYYLEWCFGSDCSESIVLIGSTTIWQNGYDSEFSLTDSTSLVIPVTSSRNNQVYTCSVNYDFGNGLGRGSLTITIAVPPSITHHPSSMSPNEGTSSVTLSCQATGTPTPTFTWTKDGSDLQTNLPKYTVTGGSLVIHNIVRSDDGQYKCVADNGYGTAALSNAATLTVHFKPSSVTLTGYTNPVNNGDTLILVCETESSNPHADISWFKNDISLTSTPTETIKTFTTSGSDNGGEKTRQELHITLSKTHNGVQFQCHARNSQFPMNTKVESANQGINVYFPPLSVFLSADKFNPVQEDTTLTLTCTTESSNPVATVSWYKNGVLWSPSDGETLRSAEQSNGINGGKVTTQQLTITLTPYHNRDMYTCKGRNDQFSDDVVESNEILLSVYYSPYVVNATENSRSAANEGDPALLICEVNCNPEATFKWYKDGNEVIDRELSTIETKEGSVFKSKLLIPFTERSDHGEYTCQAVNEIGNVNFSITLEAKSKPEAPVDIELLSRSYDSLAIEIIPGFHGGEPDNIVYYVDYHESTQSDWQPWPSNGQGSKEKQLTVTGLTENTLYVLKARAGNSLGIGLHSTENMFQTYGKPVVNFDAKSGILSWTRHENPDFVCIKVEVLVDTGDWLVENDCVDPAITEYTVNHKTATYRIVYCKLHGICDQSQFYATSEEVKNGKSSNTGLLAGTITTVIVVIAVVVLLVILLKRRHDKKKCGEDTELTGVELEAKPYEVMRPKDLKDDDIEVQYEDISKEHNKSQVRSEKVDLKVLSDETSYADLSTTRAEGMYMKLGEKALEFPRNNLKVDSIIYNGMFHRIAEGKALNIGGKEGIIKVAIKMSRDDNIGNNDGDILNEIELLKSMSGHPNIINLLGCCTKTAPHYLIMPYFTFGNLKVFLKDNRQFVRGDPGGISSRQLLLFVRDVAKGMEYLSDNNVVHRYLAAEHVMVENSLGCKISQFGYASNVIDVAKLYEKMQVY
ncbi:fibroblast growth factor receptor 2-like isoform X3 [Glandiceps talaboti]